jgi:hypothetical protein
VFFLLLTLLASIFSSFLLFIDLISLVLAGIAPPVVVYTASSARDRFEGAGIDVEQNAQRGGTTNYPFPENVVFFLFDANPVINPH